MPELTQTQLTAKFKLALASSNERAVATLINQGVDLKPYMKNEESYNAIADLSTQQITQGLDASARQAAKILIKNNIA